LPEVSVKVVNPDEAACKICKLVLVMVPHKPDFSPVATNSNDKSVEYVDAII
jgi:hypothetical protein